MVSSETFDCPLGFATGRCGLQAGDFRLIRADFFLRLRGRHLKCTLAVQVGPAVGDPARDVKLVSDLIRGVLLIENKLEGIGLELMSEPAAGHGQGRILQKRLYRSRLARRFFTLILSRNFLHTEPQQLVFVLKNLHETIPEISVNAFRII